jgi:hypothetical protein
MSAVSVLAVFYVCYRILTLKEQVSAGDCGEGATPMECQLPSPPPHRIFEALP